MSTGSQREQRDVEDAHPPAESGMQLIASRQHAPPASWPYPGAHVEVLFADGSRHAATVHQIGDAQCLVAFASGSQHWVETRALSGSAHEMAGRYGAGHGTQAASTKSVGATVAKVAVAIGCGMTLGSYMADWIPSVFIVSSTSGYALVKFAAEVLVKLSGGSGPFDTGAILKVLAVLVLLVAPAGFALLAAIQVPGARSSAQRRSVAVTTFLPLLMWGLAAAYLASAISNNDPLSQKIASQALSSALEHAGPGFWSCLRGMAISLVGALVLTRCRVDTSAGAPVPRTGQPVYRPAYPPVAYVPPPGSDAHPVASEARATSAARRPVWLAVPAAVVLVGVALVLALGLGRGATSASAAQPASAPVPKPLAEVPSVGIAKLQPSSVSASSAILQPNDSHPPEHAFDGNPKTAWNESAPGPGRGEWIEAKFDVPHAIRRIRMTTGYAEVSPRYGDLFTANAHLKRLSVQIDGRTVRTIDVDSLQRELVIDDLDEHGQTVRFVADDVFSGKKWQDLCISEISILGE